MKMDANPSGHNFAREFYISTNYSQKVVRKGPMINTETATVLHQGQEGTERKDAFDPNSVRKIYEQALERSTKSGSELTEMVKVADLGGTKELVVSAMVEISNLNKKREGAASKFLRKFVPEAIAKKFETNVVESTTESSSVADVSRKLLNAVSERRDRVGALTDRLYDLRDNMDATLKDFEAIVGGIDEVLQDPKTSDREITHFKVLKSEILETISYHRDNIISASGTIQAAELAMVQISQQIPKLRSQINDSMSIRGILAELEEVTSLCDTISEVATEMRIENREVMRTSLMGVIDKSVMSDKQLALISSNAIAQNKISQEITSSLQQVTERRDRAIETLERANEEINKHNALLEFTKSE